MLIFSVEPFSRQLPDSSQTAPDKKVCDHLIKERGGGPQISHFRDMFSKGCSNKNDAF